MRNELWEHLASIKTERSVEAVIGICLKSVMGWCGCDQNLDNNSNCHYERLNWLRNWIKLFHTLNNTVMYISCTKLHMVLGRKY